MIIQRWSSVISAEHGAVSPADGGASLLLSIDQGTTNTKALLVEAATGSVVAVGSRPVGIAFPAPAWVEQDATELWQATM
ncbi:MAG: hypothetical protein HGA44_19250, partial [Cellulomonadaceae bacterium]|nr:hypothetical protein [Cellulomonadaceae bacterium]